MLIDGSFTLMEKKVFCDSSVWSVEVRDFCDIFSSFFLLLFWEKLIVIYRQYFV